MSNLWPTPPREIRLQVNRILGRNLYRDMGVAWREELARVRRETGLALPFTREQQQRPWSILHPPKGLEGPADPTSVHYLGAARDVGWGAWPASVKETLARRLEARGWAVERTRAGAVLPRHLHFGLAKATFRASGLVPIARMIEQALERAGQ